MHEKEEEEAEKARLKEEEATKRKKKEEEEAVKARSAQEEATKERERLEEEVNKTSKTEEQDKQKQVDLEKARQREEEAEKATQKEEEEAEKAVEAEEEAIKEREREEEEAMKAKEAEEHAAAERQREVEEATKARHKEESAKFGDSSDEDIQLSSEPELSMGPNDERADLPDLDSEPSFGDDLDDFKMSTRTIDDLLGSKGSGDAPTPAAPSSMQLKPGQCPQCKGTGCNKQLDDCQACGGSGKVEDAWDGVI